MLKSKAKHAAIAARLSKHFDFKADKPLVVQYEVTMQVRSLFSTVSIAMAMRIASAVPQLANPINSNCH